MAAPVSSFLHRTSWLALLGGGLALFVVLALFTTPFHLMRLEKSGATAEENRAIKSEINTAFSESAIEIARGVVKEMRDRTKDPEQRAELDRTLEEIDQARRELRDQTREAARESRRAARDAQRETKRAIAEAQKQAAQALKDSGLSGAEVQRAIERALEESKRAEEDARRLDKLDDLPPPPEDGKHPDVIVVAPGLKPPAFNLDAPKGPTINPGIQLPPELKQEIRKKVSGDLYRIGIGSALMILFIPLFILAVVSKIFIDRSRAAQAVAETKRKEADYHRMSQQVTEAKLSALQAQVEPHFLYNTLASVQALTEVDPQRASAMTAHLIQYLRNALPKMRDSVSTVGQEVELVRAYLNILQMRMGKRLSFEIDVPPELADAPFPPLMLPSLVENAIKHGLEPQREGGIVRISAEAEGDRLRLICSDTGRGFGETETVGTGLGLSNIRERLAALYGDDGKLTLQANEPHGVKATIEVPKSRVAAAARASASGFTASAAPAAAPDSPDPQPAPGSPQWATRTLSVAASAERAWRKGLSFAFVVLTVVAAVLAGLSIVAIATGFMPVQIGEETLGGASGTLLGTAVIAAAFAVVVIALAIVLAVVYGLGFLFVGLAIFIPLVILVSLFPVLAPFILLGLGIWWLVRRSKQAAKQTT